MGIGVENRKNECLEGNIERTLLIAGGMRLEISGEQCSLHSDRISRVGQLFDG